MDTTRSLLSGVCIGAALMYVMDPHRGKRRRAIGRDKMIRAMHRASNGMEVTARDLANRTQGVLAETRSMLSTDDVSDDVLVERVRSKMGRYVSHPGSIEVSTNNGSVILRGPVRANEVQGLLRCVRSVRGVREVDNQLEVHEQSNNVPGLQGDGQRLGSPSMMSRENWSPTSRLLASMLGGALTAYGARQRNLMGLGLGSIGLGLLMRGLTNLDMSRLVGIGNGYRGIDVIKTINIDAPVDEVFRFWDSYENFPRFMRYVRRVSAGPSGMSHWEVAGPAGIPVAWDAEITARMPNQLLAWKTVPGSVIKHSGIIRFSRNPDNTTRIDIRLSYSPPAGAIGHAIAWLFGADAKSEMDADLVRMKTLIETGNPPHDASMRRERASMARR